MFKEALAAAVMTASALVVPVAMQTQPANAAGTTEQVIRPSTTGDCPGGSCRGRHHHHRHHRHHRERLPQQQQQQQQQQGRGGQQQQQQQQQHGRGGQQQQQQQQ
ncbi:hypothetical protein [Microbispora sp. NBRC 16548]|uniref:hypothetical protein n=1 Tax=Microbispora sp. NBRC 16548 TaxID=3030994 RepID=UPI00160C4D8C|nr:hypothetical protein [Microbispora sp. NBRC 16548]GLX09741.1 hypothetical protein Misp03_66670 [Microbispora sp. NBRC 16548]